MEPIRTWDNRRKELESETLEAHKANLLKLSENPIQEINLEEHPNLLIFPKDFKTYKDDIGKEKIFEIDGDCMITGNIMGFVGYNGTQVSIRSRFAEDEGKDYFLHYMLQKVLCLNVFNLDFQSDRESVFDFLIYLFPGFLKEALRQGTYREYQVRNYNDANIRGRIDIARHIKQNIPFTGKVAYSTREYVTDNHVTQLIRHTIEYVKQHPMGGDILNVDEKTREAVGIINACTPTYNRMERQNVVSQNLRPLSHPYYYAYKDLQRLCMRILRHEELKYGTDDNQIHGILFDGAWLWEEYLNTFLSDLGFEHPRNKEGIGHKSLFTDGSSWCYPDFLGQQMVLDAKYKWYSDWDKVKTDDLYQVISYMHVLNREKGGYIVPIDWAGHKIPTKTLNGKGGEMSVFGMNVAFETKKYPDFKKHMASEEKCIAQLIKTKLKQQVK